jgi:hypothetical protein
MEGKLITLTDHHIQYATRDIGVDKRKAYINCGQQQRQHNYPFMFFEIIYKYFHRDRKNKKREWLSSSFPLI